jgi:hypothetical protein
MIRSGGAAFLLCALKDQCHCYRLIKPLLLSNNWGMITLWIADKVESAMGNEKNLATDALNLVKRKLKK